MDISGISHAGVGPSLWVGRAGHGALTVRNGGIVQLDSGAVLAPDQKTSLYTSGDEGGLTGGTGILTIDGANSGILLQGNNAVVEIGRNGLGNAFISDGGSLIFGDFNGKVLVGSTVDGFGTLAINGPTSFIGIGTGGLLGIGVDADKNAAGTGFVSLNGGAIHSDEVYVGAGGVLAGNGTIVGTLVVDGGLVGLGFSPGRLVVMAGLFGLGWVARRR